MRTSCTACRYSVAPGTTASFGRKRLMIWSAVTLRSLSGFSAMNTRPVLVVVPPPPPVNDQHGVDRRILFDDRGELLDLSFASPERKSPGPR